MFAKLKVLLLLAEFPFWRAARHLSYSAQLGIEDGLRTNGVNCLTLTSPCFPQALRLLSKHRFDQLWVVSRVDLFDETSLEQLVPIAPVRIALIADSLEYTEDEQRISPTLRERKNSIEKRLELMTHVLLCDERDAETINALGKPALWWPQAVPERFIARDYQCPSRNKAVFYGACYGLRREWLGHPDLKRLLVYPKSPETSTLYPLLFNILHLPFFVSWPSVVPIRQEFFTAYLKRLRHVRERCFKRWLRALQTGHAVVNLPHFVKTYAGRVVEGMAAGRPVVSWEIPDRPQNRALFEDEKEILLFRSDNPDQLVLHLERILGDTALRQRLVVNARKKVLQFHTAQIRVRQILNWVGNGQIPRYS